MGFFKLVRGPAASSCLAISLATADDEDGPPDVGGDCLVVPDC